MNIFSKNKCIIEMSDDDDDTTNMSSQIHNKVIKNLSDHPFVISNLENARNIAKFRIFSLKKLY